MLTKKILKYVRKAEKARLAGDDSVSDKYRAAAIELIKQCKVVTEDEFAQVFDHAPIEARDTYWLVMHAKEQWGELDNTINNIPNCPFCRNGKISTLTILGERKTWKLICKSCGYIFTTMEL